MQSSNKNNWKDILASDECKNCTNPILVYVETVLSKAKPNLSKRKITFTLGDPAVYPEFQADRSVTNLMIQDVAETLPLQEPEGPHSSREYIANTYSTNHWKLTADDVFLTMGGSSALCLLFNVLVNPGDNILVPHPGFPLIFALAESRNANIVAYNLENGDDGYINLPDLEDKLRDYNPKFLLINNPSNPLGTVWSDEHTKDVLALTNKYKVPIVADEMYETLIFNRFEPSCIGKLSQGQPIFVFSGLSKMCFVPGWRCGWIVCYGKQETIKDVKEGLRRMCQMFTHPNAVAALKIPEVCEASRKFASERMDLVEKKATLIRERLSDVDGITLYNTKGTLYLSIFLDFKRFKGIENSQMFALKLVEEENINVLPGSSFYKDNMIRLVILCSDEDIEEFTKRFKEFCARHSSAKGKN